VICNEISRISYSPVAWHMTIAVILSPRWGVLDFTKQFDEREEKEFWHFSFPG